MALRAIAALTFVFIATIADPPHLFKSACLFFGLDKPEGGKRLPFLWQTAACFCRFQNGSAVRTISLGIIGK
jgi:hypothetical protein